MGRAYFCPLAEDRKYLEKAGEDQGGPTDQVSGGNFPIVTLICEPGSRLEAIPHPCKWFHCLGYDHLHKIYLY